MGAGRKGSIASRRCRASSTERLIAEAGARYLQGDASTRSYARLALPGRSAVLMNSPRQPDGPPIRDGKPYSALVHLAEDVTPFVAVAGALREAGFRRPPSTPSISIRGSWCWRISATPCSAARCAVAAPWASFGPPAVDVLVALAEKEPAELLPIEGHAPYRLPPYDADAMLIEASLLIDWFWPALHGEAAPPDLIEEFEALWRPLLAEAEKADSRLGAQGLSFAEPDVAAGAGGHQTGRDSRLSGRASGAARL